MSSVFGLTRSSGPGKVHYKAGYLSEGWPVSREVEALGYVSKRTLAGRRKYLASDAGAVRYIAAILRALSTATKHETLVNCSPEDLTALYSRFDLNEAEYMSTSGIDVAQLLHKQRAARWVSAHHNIFNVLPEPNACKKRHI